MGEFNNDENILKQTDAKFYLGTFNQLFDYISFSDVFIHVQSYEIGEPLQFGSPMTWAMSCGIPVISLDQGAAQMHIVHGWNGFLCETYNDIGWAMKYFIDYPEEIERMGANSRLRATSFYSPQIIGKRYKEIYEEIVNE